MPAKIVINLEKRTGNESFVVKSTTNTLDPLVGTVLSKKEVEELLRGSGVRTGTTVINVK